MKTIAIGGDHAGVELKSILISKLGSMGFEVKDFGPNSLDSVDYPDFAHPLSKEVSEGKVDIGILICGSANGVAITANKHSDVRAAICWKKEIASLARQHNNANILCLPARFLSTKEAEEITETFLNTAFEGGRHANRVGKINC